jgi:GxxExxY protein
LEAEHEPVPAEVERTARQAIGAAIEVHRLLGAGFLESIYERALIHELNLRGLAVRRQVPVSITYKGLEITGQRMDIVLDPGVIVELKAIEALMPVHEAQLISYLKATGYRLGLLMNFNCTLMKDGIRRIIN